MSGVSVTATGAGPATCPPAPAMPAMPQRVSWCYGVRQQQWLGGNGNSTARVTMAPQVAFSALRLRLRLRDELSYGTHRVTELIDVSLPLSQ